MFFGYWELDSNMSIQKVTKDNSPIIERNAGIVVESSFDYDFLVGGTECKDIESVTANCGCTKLFLCKGNRFDYSEPFHVNVQLNKKQLGDGRQDFFIKFTDGTAIECQLTYEYIPPPFLNPEELLFFEDVNEKEIIFCFPDEEGITIQKISLPNGITWRRDSTKEARYEIRLIFEINRSIFNSDSTGNIEVFTSSQKMSRFSLPYLVLYP
jgi:hypothetical protein